MTADDTPRHHKLFMRDIYIYVGVLISAAVYHTIGKKCHAWKEQGKDVDEQFFIFFGDNLFWNSVFSIHQFS